MTQTETFPGHLHHTPVKELMTPAKNLQKLEKEAPAPTVCTAILRHGHVWIIADDDPGSLAGIITMTDTLTMFALPVGDQEYDKPTLQSLSYGLPLTATDIMTPKPLSILPTEPLSRAVSLMKELRVKQLPVVDETHRFLGEITSQQIINRFLHSPRTKTE